MVVLSLAAAFLLGVYLGDGGNLPPGALASFALAAALFALLLGAYRRSALPALLLLLAVLGVARSGVAAAASPDSVAAYHDSATVRLQGVVVSDAEAAGSALRFRLAADRIAPGRDWIDASGDVLVTLRPTTELVRARESPRVRYGDRLLLVGVVGEPPELEGFDYPAFLESQGISSVISFPDVSLLNEGEGSWLRRALSGMRRSLAGSIARVVPEPQAALGQALVVGKRDRLPEQMVEDFRVSGTSHLLAISGLHLGILLGLSLAVSAWLMGRRGQVYLVVPLLLMWVYASLAGMSPSVVRAAIMGSIYLAALALGRPRSVLPALGLAAAVMVAFEPRVLWSVSFQLSFAAMAGIATLSESIASKLRAITGAGRDESQGVDALSVLVVRTVSTTIAATLATAPIVAFYFERVSLVGIPATLLTLPALPLVLVTQTAAGIGGLVVQPLGQAFGWLAWAATAYLSGVVAVVSRIPGRRSKWAR